MIAPIQHCINSLLQSMIKLSIFVQKCIKKTSSVGHLNADVVSIEPLKPSQQTLRQLELRYKSDEYLAHVNYK